VIITPELILLVLAFSKSDEFEGGELSQKIKNGDQEAFKLFFEKHNQPLYRFLVSRGVDGPVAEDLVQKAFLIIWEKRNGINPEKSLKAYLFQIAYSRMLNHIRDHKKFYDGDDIPDQTNSTTPEDDLENHQLKMAIDRAVAAMPDKRRMVFEFCFLKDFTYRETAEAMDVSVKTVENHMALALKDMRHSLKMYRENNNID
jgi:RNA polymerase sigma-70 factor, ECF subfamily